MRSEEGEGGFVREAGRYLAAGAAALAIAVPGEEAGAQDFAPIDQYVCEMEEGVAGGLSYEDTWFTRDRDYLVDVIREKLARVEGCERRDWEGSLYEEGFDGKKAEYISTTGLNQINALLDGLQDEETLERIGRLVRNDLREGEVAVDGVKARLLSSETGDDVRSVVKRGPDGYVVEGEFTVESDETEWGGLVEWWDGNLEFNVYEPAKEDGDGKYIPSEALLAQANDTIRVDKIKKPEEYPARSSEDITYPVEDETLRFHFHAVDRAGDREFSGPSVPDLMSVDGVGAGVVVTALGTDEDGEIVVNLDWYASDVAKDEDGDVSIGAVVDLGMYRTGVELPADMRNCRSREVGRQTVPDMEPETEDEEEVDLDALTEVGWE